MKATAFWANPCGEWIYDRCKSCGHVELRQHPAIEQLQHYYDSVYQYSEEDFRRAARQRYLSAVEDAVKWAALSDRTVLEVGCNTGALLAVLRQKGWTVAGTEPGGRFRRVAQERGLDVRPHLADWVGKRFGVVVCFHVLEHMLDASAELRVVRDMLHAGGVLVVKTPNVTCLTARLFPAEWEWSSPPAHVRLYSPASLGLELARAGFELLDLVSLRGNARPLPFLVARALGLRLKGHRRPTPGLDADHVPVSRKGWYRMAETIAGVVSLLGLPVQPLVNHSMLAPELGAVAIVR